jgi:hypothetical protein
MSLHDQIQTDMVSAMRAKDTVRLGTLRMVKTALKNKQVETGAEPDDDGVIAVLNTLVKQRRDSADQFRKGGREQMAAREEEEITVIETYLPAPASEDDVRAAIAHAVEETGAAGMKDMGRVMKATLAHLAGKTVDGGAVSRLVKESLSG